ncbi:MAG: peptidylprolyl isomerase [Sphingomonas sp.]
MLIPLLALLAGAQAAPAPPLPSDAIAADWRPIPDDEVMVVTLTGNRSVVIRLAPRFAPEHVANVRALALAHWWDETSVYRVQENWVTQWGDATEKKPLAPGVVPSPAPEFDIAAFDASQRLSRSDAYSTTSGVTADGWPIVTDGKAPGYRIAMPPWAWRAMLCPTPAAVPSCSPRSAARRVGSTATIRSSDESSRA